jgi:hypothetical protein
VSRRQRIPLNYRTSQCVQPPVTRPGEHAQDRHRLVVAETPSSHPPSEKPQTGTDELAALRAFFEMLSQWDDAVTKGETKHE